MTTTARRMTMLGLLGAAVGFAALIAWAATGRDVASGFAAVWAEGWGRVALVDLYVGLIFAGGWIWALERNLKRVVGWWLLLFCLGNLATLIYLLHRLRRAKDAREWLLGGQPVR